MKTITKCVICDAVYHKNCAERNICCENQQLEKAQDEEDDISGNNSESQTLNYDLKRILMEYMLKKICQKQNLNINY